MNFRAVKAIYLFEMARTWRTIYQSIVAPVISTSLYFVVFGSAIGSRITEIDGISYGAFIQPFMKFKLGEKQLTLELHKRLDNSPASLAGYNLVRSPDGRQLTYAYDSQGKRTGITALLKDLHAAGIKFNDLHTRQSSLEDIFVKLVKRQT